MSLINTEIFKDEKVFKIFGIYLESIFDVDGTIACLQSRVQAAKDAMTTLEKFGSVNPAEYDTVDKIVAEIGKLLYDDCDFINVSESFVHDINYIRNLNKHYCNAKTAHIDLSKKYDVYIDLKNTIVNCDGSKEYSELNVDVRHVKEYDSNIFRSLFENRKKVIPFLHIEKEGNDTITELLNMYVAYFRTLPDNHKFSLKY